MISSDLVSVRLVIRVMNLLSINQNTVYLHQITCINNLQALVLLKYLKYA